MVIDPLVTYEKLLEVLNNEMKGIDEQSDEDFKQSLANVSNAVINFTANFILKVSDHSLMTPSEMCVLMSTHIYNTVKPNSNEAKE